MSLCIGYSCGHFLRSSDTLVCPSHQHEPQALSLDRRVSGDVAGDAVTELLLMLLVMLSAAVTDFHLPIPPTSPRLISWAVVTTRPRLASPPKDVKNIH